MFNTAIAPGQAAPASSLFALIASVAVTFGTLVVLFG